MPRQTSNPTITPTPEIQAAFQAAVTAHLNAWDTIRALERACGYEIDGIDGAVEIFAIAAELTSAELTSAELCDTRTVMPDCEDFLAYLEANTQMRRL